jgi:aromatic ring-opening dioxygenase catalytic subunit (LigB family)
MISKRQPVLAISHGGGPCFQVEFPPPFAPEVWAPLKAYLTKAGATLDPRPNAILVVSGHWEESIPTVNTVDDHTLLYDYYGFPPEAYRLRYPAKGAPGVANRVRDLLAQADMESRTESLRGLDHGVFVPFMVMFPDADIPIVQLSLRRDLDPAFHLALGRTLMPLRDEDVLIIGSGSSYHNLREFLPHPRADLNSRLFDVWLNEAMTAPSATQREEMLAAWEQAPAARACHPTSEHLIPYHVVAGAAGQDIGMRTFHGTIVGKASSGYRFG